MLSIFRVMRCLSERTTTTTNGSASGCAYLFERDDDGVWRQISKLVPEEGEPYDKAGEAVALGDDFALIGAPRRGDSRAVLPAAPTSSPQARMVNSNDIADPCECVADINGDGIVGQRDLGVLLSTYELDPGNPLHDPRADVNNDGVIDQQQISPSCLRSMKPSVRDDWCESRAVCIQSWHLACPSVIPAQAGNPGEYPVLSARNWMPACAGMTLGMNAKRMSWEGEPRRPRQRCLDAGGRQVCGEEPLAWTRRLAQSASIDVTSILPTSQALRVASSQPAWQAGDVRVGADGGCFQASRFVVEVAEVNLQAGGGQVVAQALRPFDHHDGVQVQQIVDADGLQVVGGLEAIGVDVHQRRSGGGGAGVLLDDDEGGAAHLGGVEAEPLGEPAGRSRSWAGSGGGPKRRSTSPGRRAGARGGGEPHRLLRAVGDARGGHEPCSQPRSWAGSRRPSGWRSGDERGVRRHLLDLANDGDGHAEVKLVELVG